MTRSPRISSPASQSTPGRSVVATRPTGFTLVEMLVVVSIILIVAVMALPAVGSLSKSAARRAAVSQAMGALDQARAIALSQGTTVYVALANGDPAIPEDYRHRSFAIFREVYYVERRDYLPPGETKASPYVLEVVRPWAKLPEGIAIKPLSEELAKEAPKRKFLFRFGNQNAAAGGKEIEMTYLRFNAMGLLEQADGKPWDDRFTRLRLFEGFFDASGKPVATNAARADAEESVVLSTVTGRARREEAKSAG